MSMFVLLLGSFLTCCTMYIHTYINFLGGFICVPRFRQPFLNSREECCRRMVKVRLKEVNGGVKGKVKRSSREGQGKIKRRSWEAGYIP